jgi:hypothetical protein
LDWNILTYASCVAQSKGRHYHTWLISWGGGLNNFFFFLAWPGLELQPSQSLPSLAVGSKGMCHDTWPIFANILKRCA